MADRRIHAAIFSTGVRRTSESFTAIMRHSQITLTTDTYGHLFLGQAAEAVGRFEHMLAPFHHDMALFTNINWYFGR